MAAVWTTRSRIPEHWPQRPTCQIAELIRRGYGNREIGQLLGIEMATAKKHVGQIFDKVGVDSRAQLMAKLG